MRHVKVLGQDDAEGPQRFEHLFGRGDSALVAVVGDAVSQIQLELELGNDRVEFVDAASTGVGDVARLQVVIGVELQEEGA